MIPTVPNIYDYQMTSRIGTRPVTAIEIAEHLKIDEDLIVGDFEAYLNSLIDSAVLIGEKYTGRTFIESNFVAYLDSFYFGLSYELRRCPLQSITSIERTVSGTLTAIDSATYYATNSPSFSRIALNVNYNWPTDYDCIYQAIKFSFVAGYEDDELPVDLAHAIKLHVSAMYVNRGDCSTTTSTGSAACDAKCAIPVQAKNIYGQHKIYDIRIGV